jgi:hypothetical protein
MIRRSRTAGFALLLVVATSVAVFVLAKTGSQSPRSITGRALAPSDVPVGVTSVESVKVQLARATKLFWSGDELEMFGVSQGSGADVGLGYTGAQYAPSSGEWRQWPDWPYPDPLVNPAGVWTGASFVVVGMSCIEAQPDSEGLNCARSSVEAAAFDPVKFEWLKLPSPPGAESLTNEQRDMATCCTALGSTANAAVLRIGDVFAAIDPATNAWTAVPTPPAPDSGQPYCSFSGGLLTFEPTNSTVGGALSATKTLTPYVLSNSAWISLPSIEAPTDADPRKNDFETVSARCGGDNALAIDSFWTHVYNFTLAAGAWAPLPPPNVALQPEIDSPVPPVATTPDLPPSFTGAQWTGDAFVWWNAESTTTLQNPKDNKSLDIVTHGIGVLLDPVAGAWSSVPAGPASIRASDEMAWKDGAGYAVQPSQNGSPATLIAYRPR